MGSRNRIHVLNSLFASEAIIASPFGLFIIMRPVAHVSAPGL